MKFLLGSSLVAIALTCISASAQRASMPSAGTGFGPVAHSPSAANRVILGNRGPIGPGRPGGCNRGNCVGIRHNRFYPNYYWPANYWGYSPYSYGGLDPYWELGDSTESQSSPPQQPQTIVVRDSEQKAASAPAASPKVIEVPARNTAQGRQGAHAGPAPPAVFILTSGQQLEAQRYLLTHDTLQVQHGRNRESIPLSQVNLEATIAANHARGIELQIPENRNELTLGF